MSTARLPELILASTSPYRRALVERLGVPFTCRAPGVDEDEFKAAGLAPEELALRLAIAKAQSIAAIEPAAVVIGSDQLVACGEAVLGKPGTIEGAIEQLLHLAGRQHRLITACAVAFQGEIRTHVDVTILSMRQVTRDEAARYVRADLPLDCAGSYKIESRGICLFECIEGADFTAITGLPLIGLTTILRKLGFAIP